MDPKLPFASNKCQCGSCREYFGGVRAFELHRIGPADDRSCLGVAGMENKRLTPNDKGYWTRAYGKLMERAAEPRRWGMSEGNA